jgi:hypothetical protein
LVRRRQHWKTSLFRPCGQQNGVSIVERFIRNENIRRYKKLLQEEQDEEKRNLIRKLLAEEEAKHVFARPGGRRDNPKNP